MPIIKVLATRRVMVTEEAAIVIDVPQIVADAVMSDRHKLSKSGFTLVEMYIEQAGLKIEWYEAERSEQESKFEVHPDVLGSATQSKTGNAFLDDIDTDGINGSSAYDD